MSYRPFLIYSLLLLRQTCQIDRRTDRKARRKNKGRKEGRKEEKEGTDGRTDGPTKEGKKERQKEGRKEGRNKERETKNRKTPRRGEEKRGEHVFLVLRHEGQKEDVETNLNFALEKQLATEVLCVSVSRLVDVSFFNVVPCLLFVCLLACLLAYLSVGSFCFSNRNGVVLCVADL